MAATLQYLLEDALTLVEQIGKVGSKQRNLHQSHTHAHLNRTILVRVKYSPPSAHTFAYVGVPSQLP